MLPADVSENRIVAETAGVVRIRGVEARGLVVGGVVVAEVVVLVLRPQEEMVGEYAQVDHRRRRVGETGPRIRAPLEIDRRKQHAATADGVIPVAVDENVAARGPDVMGGDPIPIRLPSGPETGTPGIAVLMPHPTAGQPHVVRRRRGDVGTGFGGRRRLGQVLHLGRLGVGPIPGSPLEALRGLAPITGHPLAARRKVAPDAADPEEIASLVVPAPVAGYPRDVGPCGFWSGGSSSMAAGGAFGATMPGRGSKVTVSAKASWTGPRVSTCAPSSEAAGGGGAAMALCKPRFTPRAASAATRERIRVGGRNRRGPVQHAVAIPSGRDARPG